MDYELMDRILELIGDLLQVGLFCYFMYATVMYHVYKNQLENDRRRRRLKKRIDERLNR